MCLSTCVSDPEIGRFLSPDPIVQSPGHSQSWNRYAYVFNSPLSYTDPSGYTGVSSGSCDAGEFQGCKPDDDVKDEIEAGAAAAEYGSNTTNVESVDNWGIQIEGGESDKPTPGGTRGTPVFMDAPVNITVSEAPFGASEDQGISRLDSSGSEASNTTGRMPVLNPFWDVTDEEQRMLNSLPRSPVQPFDNAVHTAGTNCSFTDICKIRYLELKDAIENRAFEIMGGTPTSLGDLRKMSKILVSLAASYGLAGLMTEPSILMYCGQATDTMCEAELQGPLAPTRVWVDQQLEKIRRTELEPVE